MTAARFQVRREIWSPGLKSPQTSTSSPLPELPPFVQDVQLRHLFRSSKTDAGGSTEQVRYNPVRLPPNVNFRRAGNENRLVRPVFVQTGDVLVGVGHVLSIFIFSQWSGQTLT